MYSGNTNIAPARRRSHFGNISSGAVRRSSLGSVAENDGLDCSCESQAQELQAEEMHEMKVMDNGRISRRDSLTSSTSSSTTERNVCVNNKSKFKSKRRDSLASWASGRRKRNNKSASSSATRRRGSTNSTSSFASRNSGRSSIVSMSEGDIDTFGWVSRRSSSFFGNKRRSKASETISESPLSQRQESGSMHLENLTHLAALSLSTEIVDQPEAHQQKSASSVGTASTARSYPETKILSSEEGEEATNRQRPPRPYRPSRRARMRYMPARSVQERVEELFAHERNCFDAIKMQWRAYESQLDAQQGIAYSGSGKSRHKRHGGAWSNHFGGDGSSRIAHLTDAQYLHFARAASYDEGAALALLRASNRRMLGLTCVEMESQLKTKTIFIIPGLQSREGFDVFYMRPSRYFPKQTKTSTIIDNLAYIMKAMLERERSSADGISFLANMAGWEMTNFSMNYCLQFMKCLQAENFPVDVRCFLIIDPPAWFDKIWKIMKTMLTPSFQKRVHIIPNSQLGVYLGDGYRAYLPDDMVQVGGQSSTEEMIQDFIDYRKYVEYVAEYGEDRNNNEEEEAEK